MQKPENSIFFVFGGTGNLTKDKLLPALYTIYQKNMMPDDFAFIGSGRSEFNDESYRKMLKKSMKSNTENSLEGLDKFLDHIYYIRANVKDIDDYKKIKKRLFKLNSEINSNGNFLFYLAVKPTLFTSIADNLKEVGLNQSDNEGWRRVVIEKPFGWNLASSRKLNRDFLKSFDEQQIYRIDHYLGKETVQNILAFRFANGIFEPLWNHKYIHHVEITSSERKGISGRGGYYDQIGALRDMVQNHLLQVLATVAMEPPNVFKPKAVRDEKEKILQALAPISKTNLESQVIRGQYISSELNGKHISGYREENGVKEDSATETFVALKAFIDNWRWGGVPFYIRTGKRLPTRVTEVVIHYKKIPNFLFNRAYPGEVERNQLIIRIQPDEGISLKFGLKQPGKDFNIKNVDMTFYYSELGSGKLPDAYERLLLDAMNGDPTLYSRADAVEASWEFIDPILQVWEDNPDINLYGYAAGTWGPKETRKIFEEPLTDWHNPCPELTEKNYCVL